MKKILTLWILLLSTTLLAGCVEESSDQKVKIQQEQIMQEINRQVWMPGIVNFQEKKLAKMIFELRDQEDLSTYTYITAKNTGQRLLLCKSVWFGLPYSVQYTNPMKRLYSSRSSVTVPQADPNGLFMPEWLSATWVMCVDEKWTPRPVYVENEIIVSPFKL